LEENLLKGEVTMPIKIGDIKLWSVKELSIKLSVTPITLRKYLVSGRLKGQKVGGMWYVIDEALREYFLAGHGQGKGKV